MLIGPRKISRLDSTPRSLFYGGYKGGWWDFTDPSTLRSDAGGTQIADGVGIYTALDKSGNGNTLSQATSGNRPNWNKAGYADFVSASSRYLFRTDAMGFAPGGEIDHGFTFLFWLAAPSIGTSNYIASIGNSADADPVISIGSNQTTASTMSMFIRESTGISGQGIATVLQANAFASEGRLVGCSVEGPEAGTKIQPWVNTTRGTVAAGQNGSGTHPLDRTALGCLLRTSAGSYANVAMYQALIINRNLNQSEINFVYQDWVKRAAA